MRSRLRQKVQQKREALWCFLWIDVRAFALTRSPALKFALRGFHRYEIWRLSRRVTSILGKRWHRATGLLEIDLTYRCNMRCNDCNRSVTQAPENSQITRAQMAAHVQEWIAKNYQWDRIRLLGGEPTLHPDFLGIAQDLLAYRANHAPQMVIEVITNGFGPRVNAILGKMPEGIRVMNTLKTSDVQPVHQTFNRAPLDFAEHDRSDFTNGCFTTEFSGTGLTPTGYYHCAVAGGIDRILGEGLGRDSLPEASDAMRAEMAALCRYCGHFTAQMHDVPDEKRMKP